MTLKLDDFLIKKKEPVQILDLSKCSANSNEELKKMMEKVPEYKIKMDKIKVEEVDTFEKKFSSKMWSEDGEKSAHGTVFAFANPIPCDMRSLRLEDLCLVNIQWKMLTSLRPKSKSDEDYFSKLVEFGKLQLRARQTERNKKLAWYMRKSKNKAGITEVKIISCRECGEEFCSNEICRLFAYDSYERCASASLIEKQLAGELQTNSTDDAACAKSTTKKTKRRSTAGTVTRTRTRVKKLNKSSAASISRLKRGGSHRDARRTATGDPLTANTTLKDESAVKVKTVHRPHPLVLGRRKRKGERSSKY